MIKYSVSIMILILTGCSSTTVYEDDENPETQLNTTVSNAGIGGSSNTINSNIGGNISSNTKTLNVGGMTSINSISTVIGGSSFVNSNTTAPSTSVLQLVPETCLEAGKRISGLDNHPACGKVIDKNNNEMICNNSCENGFKCGGGLLDLNQENPQIVADEYTMEAIHDMFSKKSFLNVCGEECVRLLQGGNDFVGICLPEQKTVMCGWNETPQNCTLKTDNIWCCDTSAKNYNTINAR